MEYTDIRYSWHYYVYWFCECQSSTTGGRMVSKWIVWGRAVSCLHNQAPIETQLTPCDGIHWHQVTVTFLHVLILWVPEQHNWRRMVSKWIVWGRAVSCLHNQSPNWNTIDFLRWNTLTSGTVTLLRVLILECQSSTTGGRMVSKWIVWGRAVSCLHNQAPNWNTIGSLWWN